MRLCEPPPRRRVEGCSGWLAGQGAGQLIWHHGTAKQPGRGALCGCCFALFVDARALVSRLSRTGLRCAAVLCMPPPRCSTTNACPMQPALIILTVRSCAQGGHTYILSTVVLLLCCFVVVAHIASTVVLLLCCSLHTHCFFCVAPSLHSHDSPQTPPASQALPPHSPKRRRPFHRPRTCSCECCMPCLLGRRW